MKRFMDNIGSIFSSVGVALAIGGVGYLAYVGAQESAKQQAERKRIFDEAVRNPRYENLPDYRMVSRKWDDMLTDMSRELVNIEDDIETAQELRYAAARNDDDDKHRTARYRVRSLREDLENKRRDIQRLRKDKERLDSIIDKLEGNDRIGRAAGLF